ncbi:uncharacterized protein FPOAC1_013510 [Fusarium poae]|uniref:uncharacterized protein n=1 Tax=Fusarium poae TaxID=36050 RepID=UPI001D043E0B|nr:uncharacterized protein FPOAC1_013510 [Fusarium poae]KAG8664730.1 hypothetical protein FPOAC1_013510 [Fusarium poae]
MPSQSNLRAAQAVVLSRQRLRRGLNRDAAGRRKKPLTLRAAEARYASSARASIGRIVKRLEAANTVDYEDVVDPKMGRPRQLTDEEEEAIRQLQSLISYVRSEYDHTGEKLFQGSNVWVSLVGILTKMLEDPILKDVVLVVDALDECITDRPKLLDFIVQTSSSSSSHVKWIISSRNEQDIQGALDYAEQKVRLHLELNPDSISKAVGTYIKYKVGQLARRKNYDTQTRDAISNHLTSNANDTFLWVALVCQELADSELTRKRHTLAKLKSFPPGLNPLYKRMMEQISNSDDADICKEILATASVVYRPITLEELKVLAPSLEDDDYDDLPQIISSCGSFLTLREGVIYLVHQSAKEFLLNEVSDQVLTYGEVHQHHAIFSKSLTALSQTTFVN